MACNPPLNFVDNGAPGSAFPPPLDPTPPTINNSPTFTDTASSILDDLATDADGFDSAVSDASALVEAIDVLAAASDSQLALILEELDSVVGQQPINDALDAFDGAQPGATALLGDVSGIATPALGQVPMVLPNGAATITFGGPPEQGGPATAGAAPYTLHLRVLRAGPGGIPPRALELTGPNPPFVGVETGLGPMLRETESDGSTWWVAPVLINPTQAGQYTAVLYYALDATIAGISGTFQRTLPFEVVVENG